MSWKFVIVVALVCATATAHRFAVAWEERPAVTCVAVGAGS